MTRTKAGEPVVDNTLPEVPIDPATGEEYKAGEVPPGSNVPVGGEFLGDEAERLKCEEERAERAAKIAEERAEEERKRLADAAAHWAKEEAAPTPTPLPAPKADDEPAPKERGGLFRRDR